MSGRIEGRIALITGAASGIGLATARRFAEEGATIAGLDLQKPVNDASFVTGHALVVDGGWTAGHRVRLPG